MFRNTRKNDGWNQSREYVIYTYVDKIFSGHKEESEKIREI